MASCATRWDWPSASARGNRRRSSSKSSNSFHQLLSVHATVSHTASPFTEGCHEKTCPPRARRHKLTSPHVLTADGVRTSHQLELLQASTPTCRQSRHSHPGQSHSHCCSPCHPPASRSLAGTAPGAPEGQRRKSGNERQLGLSNTNMINTYTDGTHQRPEPHPHTCGRAMLIISCLPSISNSRPLSASVSTRRAMGRSVKWTNA